ncbi:CarD family transcriptional regulator [Ferdinandcohnia quinoae]|uniref:Transcription factor YdeB n=1 Tax=Fredinandcohnia quinoae TaxID=2918902 RepID=A0AAW5E296_9BACI|nr:CarD family transcriptional regulator [Fredinandcohnia sp. SECRCQ15]MCH1627032.1 transcription factor YdeB [Fredinandcohnia sp. SECRCQ15]
MFQVGDKVFYPMYGAGIIDAIKEMEIQGETQNYYVITIPLSKMNVMIPMNKIKKSRIRSVVDQHTIKEILFNFHNVEPDCSLPWKERLQKNTEKMKTGLMQDTAEVVRDLTYFKKDKVLNHSERQLLDNARNILLSELILANDMTELQAENLIDMTS